MKKIVATIIVAASCVLVGIAPSANAARTGPGQRDTNHSRSTICSGSGSSWYYCKAYPFRPNAWTLAGWR